MACTVAEEGPDLPRDIFDARYRHTRTPVVIRNATTITTAAFRAATTIEALLRSYGSEYVTLSSANAFSYGRQRATVAEYMSVSLGPEAQAMWERAADDDGAASGIYYWFGEHGSELRSLISSYPLPKYTYPIARGQRGVKAETKLLRRVTSFFGDSEAGTEPTADEDRLFPREPALSFGVGPDGSGVPFHFHNDGFSEVMHGSKLWLLYPHKPPRFRENATSVSWLKHDYPNLASSERPLECTIVPGDLLYFPKDWWHAIINRGEVTVFMSTFL